MARTIKQMHKDELIKLIEVTVQNIDKINEFFELTEQNKQKITDTENEMTWPWWHLSKITTIVSDIESKASKIQATYNMICVDGGKEDCLENKAVDSITTINQKEKEIDNFFIKLFGKEATQTEEQIPGISSKITSFYTEQTEKYKVFFEQIERELNAWVTSVVLAKTFSDKVKQYSDESNNWGWWFIVVLSISLIYLWFTLFFNPMELKTSNIINTIFYRSPLYVFLIWLIIFLWNRRAEAKKLAESYKHKEVLARSFVWYRETIKNLTPDDTELLKKHMETLLLTISLDSWKFLSDEWDKHPILNMMTSFLSKTDKREV